jgi:hypothetical protein
VPSLPGKGCVKVFALGHPTSRVRCHKFPENATSFFADMGAGDSGVGGLLKESEQSGAGGKAEASYCPKDDYLPPLTNLDDTRA